jgi:hypothetical protein
MQLSEGAPQPGMRTPKKLTKKEAARLAAKAEADSRTQDSSD